MRRARLFPLLLGSVVVLLGSSLLAQEEQGKNPLTILGVGALAHEQIEGPAPTLVFLHGWACDRTHWARQVDAFRGKYRMLVVDLAGHGSSSNRHKTDWTVVALADDVVSLVRGQDLEQVILVGHSMGGTVALAAAPKLGDRAIGVIGVDCLHNAEFEYPEEVVERMVASFRADFPAAMEGFLQQALADRENADELQEIVWRSTQRIRPEVAISLFESLNAIDFPELFRSAGVPIRCINADAPFKTEVEINRKYADFDAVTLSGVSHWPMLEVPEKFNPLLEEAVKELRAGSN